jgi:hypothetical protein
MSMRHSEYARMPADTYVTPRWVYEALYTVEPWAKGAWDCAPVDAEFDFLSIVHWDCLAQQMPTWNRTIATNPPFSLAEKFCRQAIAGADKIAMLLPMEFDCAKGRQYLFQDRHFKAKYVLLRRIRWENLPQKKAGPSQNHAWFVWDRLNSNRPILGWLA